MGQCAHLPDHHDLRPQCHIFILSSEASLVQACLVDELSSCPAMPEGLRTALLRKKRLLSSMVTVVSPSQQRLDLRSPDRESSQPWPAWALWLLQQPLPLWLPVSLQGLSSFATDVMKLQTVRHDLGCGDCRRRPDDSGKTRQTRAESFGVLGPDSSGPWPGEAEAFRARGSAD